MCASSGQWHGWNLSHDMACVKLEACFGHCVACVKLCVSYVVCGWKPCFSNWCIPGHLCINAGEWRQVLRNPGSFISSDVDGWLVARREGWKELSVVAAVAFYHFMTAFRAHKALVSGCSHCNVNQMPQIKHIGYLSAVALSSPIVQITADMPISDVWHQYRSDTNCSTDSEFFNKTTLPCLFIV